MRSVPLLFAIFLSALVLVQLSGPVVQARTSSLGSGLVLDHDPESLTLGPEEEGTIVMVLENEGDRSQVVVYRYVPVDAPGASSGTFDPPSVELAPGASVEIRLTVRSNARWGQEEGVSDGMVKFAWGENLTGPDILEMDPRLFEGTYLLVIPVEDDISLITTPVLLAMFALAMVLLAILVISQRVRLRQG
jgi:hypothetical protein